MNQDRPPKQLFRGTKFGFMIQNMLNTQHQTGNDVLNPVYFLLFSTHFTAKVLKFA
jgi:hypothetical protein